MTIPVLIALNLLIGTTVAFSARKQIRTLQRHLFASRYYAALIMLDFMIIIPAGLYFCVFYPDWSWMYLVDTSKLNLAVSVMTVISYPLSASMGYLVGYYSARSNSDWVSIVFILFMALGMLGLFISASDQFSWVGTYEQYRRDIGLKPIGDTSLALSVGVAVICIGVSWLFLTLRFSKESKVTLQSW